MFPGTVVPVLVGRDRSKRLVEELLATEARLVGLVTARGDSEEPGPADLYEVGVVARVLQLFRVPDGTLSVTSILPPCSTIIRRTIASPNPLPRPLVEK